MNFLLPDEVVAEYKTRSLLLFGEINYICASDGVYSNTNAEISSRYGISKRTASKWIEELEQFGLISRVVKRGRGLRREIYVK